MVDFSFSEVLISARVLRREWEQTWKRHRTLHEPKSQRQQLNLHEALPKAQCKLTERGRGNDNKIFNIFQS